MSSMNKVILIGNLGRDPEVRSTQSGDKVANLSVATSERWKDRDGNPQERTEWHRVILWKQLAEIAEKYLAKGSKVAVEGQLQTRKWQDQSGQDRYTTEVVVRGFGGSLVMLDGKPQSSGGDNAGSGFTADQYRNASRGEADLDDDIPF